MKKYFIAAFAFLFVTVAHAQWVGVFNPGGMLKPAATGSSSFPIVQSTNSDITVTGPGVHTLPSGIQAGDLLLFFLKMNNTSNFSLPSGWTSSFNLSVGGGSTLRIALFYKVAVGGETTLSVSTSPTSVVAQYAIMYRITNYQGSPQAGTASGGSGTTVDPPNLTPAWGAADNLWIALGTSQTTNGISGVPTNYTNPIANNIKTSQRELNAASENPSAYTQPNNSWASATIAIRGL